MVDVVVVRGGEEKIRFIKRFKADQTNCLDPSLLPRSGLGFWRQLVASVPAVAQGVSDTVIDPSDYARASDGTSPP